MALAATALPTEPQALPSFFFFPYTFLPFLTYRTKSVLESLRNTTISISVCSSMRYCVHLSQSLSDFCQFSCRSLYFFLSVSLSFSYQSFSLFFIILCLFIRFSGTQDYLFNLYLYKTFFKTMHKARQNFVANSRTYIKFVTNLLPNYKHYKLQFP